MLYFREQSVPCTRVADVCFIWEVRVPYIHAGSVFCQAVSRVALAWGLKLGGGIGEARLIQRRLTHWHGVTLRDSGGGSMPVPLAQFMTMIPLHRPIVCNFKTRHRGVGNILPSLHGRSLRGRSPSVGTVMQGVRLRLRLRSLFRCGYGCVGAVVLVVVGRPGQRRSYYDENSCRIQQVGVARPPTRAPLAWWRRLCSCGGGGVLATAVIALH